MKELWLEMIQKYAEDQNYLMILIVIMIPFGIIGLAVNGIGKIIKTLFIK